ncbi:MAG: transposase [Desulfobacula sp.]|uniref:transposase n=1 Tax=Desulfobacula sp. TaxID=2593537 RepID=UPI0025BBCE6E|nr:transposase [Desulfobacula sp.]MCD4720579.1 transposase [Desulfobacula sp.]
MSEFEYRTPVIPQLNFKNISSKRCQIQESDWAIKNNKAYYGLKEHASVDINGFILKTELSPASVHDTKYFQYCTIFSLRTSNRIKKVYADKGYHGELNRSFLSLNKFQDGIMRKNTTTAKRTHD